MLRSNLYNTINCRTINRRKTNILTLFNHFFYGTTNNTIDIEKNPLTNYSTNQMGGRGDTISMSDGV